MGREGAVAGAASVPVAVPAVAVAALSELVGLVAPEVGSVVMGQLSGAGARWDEWPDGRDA
ncbi:hypothetical protein GCM10017688_06780 [Streptomyces ramulosus]